MSFALACPLIIGGILYIFIGLIYASTVIKKDFGEIWIYYTTDTHHPHNHYSVGDIVFYYLILILLFILWPLVALIRILRKFSLRKCVGYIINNFNYHND